MTLRLLYLIFVRSWAQFWHLYRFRTRHRCCDLRFDRIGWLQQYRGLCPVLSPALPDLMRVFAWLVLLGRCQAS